MYKLNSKKTRMPTNWCYKRQIFLYMYRNFYHLNVKLPISHSPLRPKAVEMFRNEART